MKKAVDASAHYEKVACDDCCCYLSNGQYQSNEFTKERVTSICAVIPNNAASAVPSKLYEYAAWAPTKGAIKMVEAKRIRTSLFSFGGRSTPHSRYSGQMMRKSIESVLTRLNMRKDKYVSVRVENVLINPTVVNDLG